MARTVGKLPFAPPPTRRAQIHALRMEEARRGAAHAFSRSRSRMLLEPFSRKDLAAKTVTGAQVLFVNRDRSSWDGGDFVEMDGFRTALDKIGIQAPCASEVSSAATFPIYHLYNAAWPWTLSAAVEIWRRDRPYLVTPIYFPRFIHRIPEPSKVRAVLERATALLVYSARERQVLTAEYPGLDGAVQFRILTKGVDSSFQGDLDADRPVEVLIAGSISPRKNQELVLQACERHGIVPTLAGPVLDAAYWSQCRKYRFNYAGNLSRAKLADLYRQSRILVLASTFDPMPNVALEAALAGCKIVLTSQTYFEEFPGAFLCEPSSISSIADAISNAVEAPLTDESQKYVQDNFDWARAAEALSKMYDELAHKTWFTPPQSL